MDTVGCPCLAGPWSWTRCTVLVTSSFRCPSRWSRWSRRGRASCRHLTTACVPRVADCAPDVRCGQRGGRRSHGAACIAHRPRIPRADSAAPCRQHGRGTSLGQLALRRPLSAPEHAPGCPELRPALAYQAPSGVRLSRGASRRRRRGGVGWCEVVWGGVGRLQTPPRCPRPVPVPPPHRDSSARPGGRGGELWRSRGVVSRLSTCRGCRYPW